MADIQKNIFLSKCTTFKIGGPAKYFCVAKNIEETKKALEFAQRNSLKIFILGGGSNLLVSDRGFDGLVIKLQITNYKFQDNKIICGAGASLAKLVNESAKANLTGLEWAAGIPGITVGGAICNNAGAFGKCMGDVVENVEILDIGKLGNKQYNRWLHSVRPAGGPAEPFCAIGSTALSGLWSQHILGNWKLEIRKLNNKQCRFSYRSSIFKEEKKYIIVGAVLKLEKGNKEESGKMIAEFLKSRREKQPLEYPSAGSVFENPIVGDKHLEKLIDKYPELKGIAKNNAIPAGWLVETLELKGKKIGGAMISEKHGNFIVNASGAKAEDVVILISLTKQKVRDNFGIQLVEEIEYVGF